MGATGKDFPNIPGQQKTFPPGPGDLNPHLSPVHQNMHRCVFRFTCVPHTQRETQRQVRYSHAPRAHGGQWGEPREQAASCPASPVGGRSLETGRAAPWGPGGREGVWAGEAPRPLSGKSPPPTWERTTPRAGGDPGSLSREQKIPLTLGLFPQAEGWGRQALRERPGLACLRTPHLLAPHTSSRKEGCPCPACKMGR